MISRYLFSLFSLTISLVYFSSITTSHAAACTDQSAGYTGDCTGEASTYNMTMKALRLRKANSDEFVTLVVRDETFNFAAVGAGQTVGGYLTDGTIPPGVYDAISPILAPTLTVAGSTSIGGGATCRTGSDTDDLTDGGAAIDQIDDMDSGAPSGTDSSSSFGMDRDTDQQYINPDGNFVLLDSSISGFPITVTENSSVSIVMTIDAGESMEYSWTSGACDDAYSGGIQVTLTATVTEAE